MLIAPRLKPAHPRLGELFAAAGIIPGELIEQSLSVAKSSRMPLGRVLVMSGHLTVRELDGALKVQQMRQQGRVGCEKSRELIQVVRAQGITIDEALSQQSWERAYAKPYNQLGKILLASDVVSERIIAEASARHAETGAALGRLLVEEYLLPKSMLVDALNALVLIRDGQLTRLEAVQALQKSVRLQRTLNDVLEIPCQSDPNKMRFGEILYAAGIVTQEQVLDALEESLERKTVLGSILSQGGHLPPRVVESTLQLQKMVEDGIIRSHKAIELLRLVVQLDEPLEDILTELERLRQVIKFLCASGVVSEEYLEEVSGAAVDLDESVVLDLYARGIIYPEMVTKGAHCLTLHHNGYLTVDQASQAVRIAVEKNIEPAQALREVNFNTSESEEKPAA